MTPTALDFGLLAVMLISGVLAMVRGFMREVLSIASWVIAAVVTLYGYSRVLPFVKQYVHNDLFATGIAVGGLFLLTLLVVSLFTVKISDIVLDSRVGALDRTLGFFYGAARGILVVAVGLMFFNWLVGANPPAWVSEAKSRPLLESVGNYLQSLLPEDPENSILKRFSPSGSDAEDVPAETGTEQPPTEGAPADGGAAATPPAEQAPANN